MLPVLGYTFLDDPQIDAAIVAAVGFVVAIVIAASRYRRSDGMPRCRKCWYILLGTESLVCPECGHDNSREKNLQAPLLRWKVAAAVALFALLPAAYVGYAVYRTNVTKLSLYSDDRSAVGNRTFELTGFRRPDWWQKPGEMLYPTWSLDGDLSPFSKAYTLRIRGSIECNVEAASDVSHVQIYDIDGLNIASLQMLNKLPNLDHIDFINTRFAGSDDEAPDWLKRVTEINFYDCADDNDDLKVLAKADQLRSLHIRNQSLVERHHLGGRMLQHLPPNLRTLGLDRVAIDPADLSQLDHSAVRDLIIHNTTMSDEHLQQIARLQKPMSLQFARNDITDDQLCHLGSMNKLMHLDLAANPVDGSGLAHLAGCQSLFSLGLNDTKVTLDALKAMPVFKNLRRVAVDRTPALQNTPVATDAELKRRGIQQGY